MQDRYMGIFKCSISSKVFIFIYCDAFLRKQKWQHAFVLGNYWFYLYCLIVILYLYKSKCLHVRVICTYSVLLLSLLFYVFKICIMNAIT